MIKLNLRDKPWYFRLCLWLLFYVSFYLIGSYIVSHALENRYLFLNSSSLDKLYKQALFHGIAFMVPTFIYYFLLKPSSDFEYFDFKPLKVSDFLILILIYLLCLPFIMLGAVASIVIIEQFKHIQWVSQAVEYSEQLNVLKLELMKNKNFSSLFSLLLVISIMPGFIEELMMRGLLYKILKSKWNIVVSSIITSLLFSFIHFNINGFLPIFLISLMLHYVYERFESMWANVFIHSFNNGIIVILFYFMM